MTAFWFLAGVACTLTCIILVLPWLRARAGRGALPAVSWRAATGAILAMAAVLGSVWWLGQSDRTVEPPAAVAPDTGGKPAQATGNTADSWEGIASALRNGAGPTGSTAGQAPQRGAEPMLGAIASLQGRLARSGGTADDWELLAKSYEFLGRKAEADQARAHQLPPLPAADSASLKADAPQTSSARSAAVVSGEVSLAPDLKAKAAAGTTLFIVAKSVDSPGAPVAVFRSTVDRWPLNFELGDAQSMLPGRTLSSAGRVTVEARISQSGQPLPAAGDLQGSSGVINPANRQPLRILIDKVIQ